MKFSELAKYKTNTELIVSARHEAWMQANGNALYNGPAMHFAAEALYNQGKPRDRRGTVSASSLGSCRRRQQFTFIGMPELPPSAKTAGIFHNGTFMHIRWQMAGLTEGWLAKAEVPVPKDNPFRLSGTMDGVLHEGSVLELKSINTNGFNAVNSFGPKEEHLYQGATYLLCTGREKVSFVYEDKNTQEFKEIVMTRDQLPMAEAEESAAVTWGLIDRKQLAEPLLECEMKDGWKYNSCQFRKDCLKIKAWEEAEECASSAQSK